jgi:hypothetical protein
MRHSISPTLAAAALFALAGASVASAAGLNTDQSQPPLSSESDNGLAAPSSVGSDLKSGLTIEDFVNADKNRDGFLSKKEFQAMAKMVENENKTSAALAKVDNFAKDDSNNDGKISAQELGVLGAGAG